MAQVIPFPGVSLPSQPQAKAKAKVSFAVVRNISGSQRVPKRNRPEDDRTISVARVAKLYAAAAHRLANTEPDSEKHRMTLHMASIVEKLPCNNLRIFTTHEDVVQGLWRLWRQVKIANLEWELCDERRFEAASSGDEKGEAIWRGKQDVADAHRWKVYERLIRIPATKLADITAYKLDRRFQNGMGSIEWMRIHKLELAAVIDDEVRQLTVEKDARKAARATQKQREP